MDEWRNNNNQNNSELIERAKEELENLEMQYPNMFNNLKMELKAFIADIDDHYSHQHHQQNYLMQLNNSSISVPAATQGGIENRVIKQKEDGRKVALMPMVKLRGVKLVTAAAAPRRWGDARQMQPLRGLNNASTKFNTSKPP